MKLVLGLIALLTIAGIWLSIGDVGNTSTEGPLFAQVELYERYNQWKQEYKPSISSEENLYRFKIFSDNLKKIEEFNAKNTQTELGLNKFAHLTLEEFQGIYLQKPYEINFNKEEAKKEEIPTNEVPVYVNWNEKGAVTPDIPNQGVCGSCWTFSTTGALEGLNAITNGNFEYFSQQQLIDCNRNKIFQGCDGSAFPFFAFQYTSQYGIEKLSDYPYLNRNNEDVHECKYDEKKVAFQNKGNTTITEAKNSQILSLLVKQPVSTLVYVTDSFMFYKRGVLLRRDCDVQSVNHAVLLTGYNLLQTFPENVPYYIVRNSWGPDWGEDGFIRLEITDKEVGTCMVNGIVSVPTL